MVNSGSSANLVMIAAIKKVLGWEDGDLVEFEILDTSDDEDNKDVVLRKIEDDVLDAELDSLREATNSKK